MRFEDLGNTTNGKRNCKKTWLIDAVNVDDASEFVRMETSIQVESAASLPAIETHFSTLTIYLPG